MEVFSTDGAILQKPAINWVISAKQEITKLSRLTTLINDSEAGRKINPLDYPKKYNF